MGKFKPTNILMLALVCAPVLTGCGTQLRILATLSAASLNATTDSLTVAGPTGTQELVETEVNAGWDFIDFHVVTSEPGKVYYAIYDALPAPLPTGEEIKNAVVAGDLVDKGTLVVAAGDTINSVTFSAGLIQNHTYYLYAIAEDANGFLLADSEIFAVNKTTATRNSIVTYNSATALADTTFVTQVAYGLYLPKEYYRYPTKKLPVLVFQHGLGESSNINDLPNTALIDDHGPPKHIANGTWDETLPFIVISPQIWNRNNPLFRNDSEGIAFMAEVMAKVNADHPGRINTDRFYVTGLSMGGNGVYHYIANAGRAATVAAMFQAAGWAGTNPTLFPATYNLNCAAKAVPIWSFHGDADGTVLIDSSRYTIPRLNSVPTCGAPAPSPLARLTEFPGVGHNSWTAMYDNTHGDSNTGGDGAAYTNVYRWALSFRRYLEVPSFAATGSGTRLRLASHVPRAGTVHYAVYDAAQGALSNAQILAAATGPAGGNLVRRGSTTVLDANTSKDTVVHLSGLTAGTTYYIYFLYVNEVAAETQDDTSVAL